MMIEAKLKTGVIFGDNVNEEYVYMPASELGMENPICVYEEKKSRTDVELEEALRLIRVRSLSPSRHPRLGTSSC